MNEQSGIDRERRMMESGRYEKPDLSFLDKPTFKMTKYQELETSLADAVKRGCEIHPDVAIRASRDMLAHYKDHLVPLLGEVRHKLRQEILRRCNEDIPSDQEEETAIAEAEEKIDGLLRWLEDAPIQAYLYVRQAKLRQETL